MTTLDWLGAVLMGLAGAGHCLGMCGGLASAFGYNQSIDRLVIYNAGRISAYTLAGLLVGSTLALAQSIHQDLLLYARLFAGIMMLLLAAYISGVWRVLVHLERGGNIIWRRIQPLLAFFPTNAGRFKLLMAGVLWGFLPCGLVYSALTWAALSGSALGGAAIMLGFGLGTLPAMLGAGIFSRQLMTWLRSVGFRYFAGLLLAAYGVITITIAIRQLL